MFPKLYQVTLRRLGFVNHVNHVPNEVHPELRLQKVLPGPNLKLLTTFNRSRILIRK